MIHLFGSSWGGMLALEYMLTRPTGVASLTLNSTPTSAPRWAVEALRLACRLPPGLDDKQAEEEFKRRHICRLDPEPEVLARARAQFGAQVYETMWGSNEFTVTGTLKEWDVIDRLGELDVPTLVTSGRHDECTPGARRAAGARDPRRRVGAVRGERPHAVPRGDRTLSRGRWARFLERVETLQCQDTSTKRVTES